jgi:hypothetical protein
MPDRETNNPFLRSIETIRLLDEQTLSSSIQHLQIPPKPASRLRDFQIQTISELSQIYKDLHEGKPARVAESGINFNWMKIQEEISPRVQHFASSIRNGKADWIFFWDAIDYDFTFAAARLVDVFQLDNDTKALPLATLNFGKALFSFADDGIHTVGDLVARLAEGLPRYRGFGISKLKDFAKGLREFVSTINTEGTRSSLVEAIVMPPAIPNYRGPLRFKAVNRKNISVAAANLTLGQLHLHKEIEKLENIGVQNLGQLLALFAEGLPEIRGVGKTGRTNLLKIAKCADSAICESGDIDWQLFSKEAGFHNFPDTNVPLSTGYEFLASLDEVVEKLTTMCFDEVETATLVDRLIPLKKDTVTLEDLGRRFGVTRERIRQKQKKVLERISAAVLEDYYEGLSFRFTQRFSQFWRAAAEYFRGVDVVSYYDFIDGLTKVWNVERRHVIPHLPLIYGILTKNSTLPSEFNDSGSLPQNIFDIKQAQDLSKPFNSLHPSKSLANTMAKNQIDSIGQLLMALKVNSSFVSRSTIDRLTSEILDPLSRAVTVNGEVAWLEFYRIRSIQCIPNMDTESPRSFVENSIGTVASFVEHTEITGRSTGIFKLRTVPGPSERKTLDQTGKLLGSQGPTIKREENELLRRLHDAIFGGDYTASSTCFRSSFIRYFRQAKKIFRQASTQDRFAELLSIEWELPISEVSKITPMIACIIDGRPKGYRRNSFLVSVPTIDYQDIRSKPNEPPTVIRLRGFRSIH